MYVYNVRCGDCIHYKDMTCKFLNLPVFPSDSIFCGYFTSSIEIKGSTEGIGTPSYKLDGTGGME